MGLPIVSIDMYIKYNLILDDAIPKYSPQKEQTPKADFSIRCFS